MQPHVIVLLSSTSSLTEAAVYAVVDPTLMYRMNSIAEAVDVVIKVCFVLDLEFSAAARSSWTFMQLAVQWRQKVKKPLIFHTFLFSFTFPTVCCMVV